MNHARADALAARQRLETLGWNPRAEDDFRHLPPPGPQVWLRDAEEAATCQEPLPQGSGWALRPLDPPSATRGDLDAHWLDATDSAQRARLLQGLPTPGAQGAAALAWAHRAMLRHGLRLRVGASGHEALRLRLDHRARSSVEAPLLVLELAPGARVVLLEFHERQTSRCPHALAVNAQLHIRLGEKAELQHLRIVEPGEDDRFAHAVNVHLGDRASYRQALLGQASAYHLQRTRIELAGRGANAHVAAVVLGQDKGLDHQVHALHKASDTHSRTRTLALGRDDTRLVANAFARIDQGCEDARVEQLLRGVPMQGQPRLILRPHMEILHDRVQASHGASCGPLPTDALFYAGQRGLPPEQARALILDGMVRQWLAGECRDETIAQALEPPLQASLERHVRTESAAAAEPPEPTRPASATGGADHG